MEAYRCAYRDPHSPLTPLAPMDSSVFTFATTPVTTNCRKANTLAPTAIDIRSKLGASVTVESQTSQKIVYSDENGVVTTCYSRTTSTKQVYKTDSVIGKYHLSPYNTKQLAVPTTQDTRTQFPATKTKIRALAPATQTNSRALVPATKTLRTLAPTKTALKSLAPPTKTLRTLTPNSKTLLTKTPTPTKKTVTIFVPPKSPFAAQPISPRVQKILKKTGMCKYAPLFEKEEINYEIFKLLCEDDLIQLGIRSQVDRDIIMNAVRYWSHFRQC